MLIDYTVLSVKMEVFLLIIDDDNRSIMKKPAPCGIPWR
jgi:hypothetical protein